MWRGGNWFRFCGPFGFGFSFGPPPFGWWGTADPDEEVRMLKEYQRFLEQELERVRERIRRLEGSRD
ncbi:MAG: DUF5320 domain-containing protein [Bacillota bacterium]